MESILSQLGAQDELIISVDPSTDNTKRIAQDFAISDTRVAVLDGPGQGVIYNFENALYAAHGAVIFLSDQDDIWHPAKLRACLAALQEGGVSAVVHDAVIVDGNLNEIQSSYFDKGFYSGVCAQHGAEPLHRLLHGRKAGRCFLLRFLFRRRYRCTTSGSA